MCSSHCSNQLFWNTATDAFNMLIIDIGTLQLSVIVQSSILCFTFMLWLTTTRLQALRHFSINQHQTTSSSDNVTDYIIRLAHQYKYNSRGLLCCRYTSFISNKQSRYFIWSRNTLEISLSKHFIAWIQELLLLLLFRSNNNGFTHGDGTVAFPIHHHTFPPGHVLGLQQ